MVWASVFHRWVRGFDSRYGLMWKESVNALPKVVGFLRVLRFPPPTVILIDGLETRKVQYNSLTMLLSSFMQEFGPISSRVYCIFVQKTNNKFVVDLSTRNLNKCSI
jgi:hypothetical protein